MCGGDDGKDNNENYNQPGGEENEEKTRGADLLFGKNYLAEKVVFDGVSDSETKALKSCKFM